ncbi:MAG: hypothetical protein GY835_19195 [bacterium]|nr:hypothetical protein [bacterium]
MSQQQDLLLRIRRLNEAIGQLRAQEQVGKGILEEGLEDANLAMVGGFLRAIKGACDAFLGVASQFTPGTGQLVKRLYDGADLGVKYVYGAGADSLAEGGADAAKAAGLMVTGTDHDLLNVAAGATTLAERGHNSQLGADPDRDLGDVASTMGDALTFFGKEVPGKGLSVAGSLASGVDQIADGFREISEMDDIKDQHREP